MKMERILDLAFETAVAIWKEERTALKRDPEDQLAEEREERTWKEILEIADLSEEIQQNPQSKGVRNMDWHEDTEMKNKGYESAKSDIKEMGIEWAKMLFGLRLRCTGVDAWFTVGYGKAIVEQAIRDNPT